MHVYEPAGEHRQIAAYLDSIGSKPWALGGAGRLEYWSYRPINATPEIAAEVVRRYRARQALGDELRT